MNAINKINILLFFSLLLLIFSCKNNNINNEETTETIDKQVIKISTEQANIAKIKFEPFTQKSISEYVEVNGVLDVPPQNLISISAMMGGFVKSTDMLQGQKVSKGKLLIEIQNPEFIQIQHEYLNSLKKLKYLGEESERQTELNKNNVGSLKEYQQATSEYQAALSLANGLKEKLILLGLNPSAIEKGKISSSIKIYSPISGYITAVNINIGKYVNPQDVICEIVDTEHLHAELTVFEKDIYKIKVGQNVNFWLVNEPEMKKTAKIYLINKKINDDRTVRVHAHLNQKDLALIPYSYLKAKIEISKKLSFAIPNHSLINNENKDVIFVFNKKASSDTTQVFEPIEVKKGIANESLTEIILPSNFDFANYELVTLNAFSLLGILNNEEED